MERSWKTIDQQPNEGISPCQQSKGALYPSATAVGSDPNNIGAESYHLLLLERNAHTVGGQIESQAPGLRVQLDDDAILIVLEIGERAALNDRHAGRDRRIVAAEIRRTGQIVDLTLGGNAGGTYISDRNLRKCYLHTITALSALVSSPCRPCLTRLGGVLYRVI